MLLFIVCLWSRRWYIYGAIGGMFVMLLLVFYSAVDDVFVMLLMVCLSRC